MFTAAIALGATIGAGSSSGVLLVVLIAVQNLPEGFNAYREWDKERHSAKKAMTFFLALALIGPAAAAAGMLLLSNNPRLLAGLMLFSAGGILYLTFQDVAPEARYRRHWARSWDFSSA